MPKTENENMNILVRDDLRKRLKRYAKERETSMSTVARQILKDGLDRIEREARPQAQQQ